MAARAGGREGPQGSPACPVRDRNRSFERVIAYIIIGTWACRHSHFTRMDSGAWALAVDRSFCCASNSTRRTLRARTSGILSSIQTQAHLGDCRVHAGNRADAVESTLVLCVWLVLIAALRFCMLSTCAPTSPTLALVDGLAKYTDEGWYGNAAIRAHLFGSCTWPGTSTQRRQFRCGRFWNGFCFILPV